MAKKVIPGQDAEVVTTDAKHFHAVFHRNGQVQHVLQRTAVNDDCIPLCEFATQRCIQIDGVGRTLVTRGIK